MKKRFILFCVLLALTGCGDGQSIETPVPDGQGGGSQSPGEQSDDGDNIPDEVLPLATSIGDPVSDPVSATIDASGGQLSSSDGVITLDIPAGVLSEVTTISIQAIENFAPGGRGLAYRLSPEGIEASGAMTIYFHYNDDLMAGTLPRLGSIAYQDADRYWRVYAAPLLNADNHSIAIQTTHFSDWSMVSGLQLVPNSATLMIGESLELQVQRCEQVEWQGDDDLSVVISLLSACDVAPLEAISTDNWAVNGIAGGGADVGIIAANSDLASGKAVFTAAEFAPQNNPLAVSVQSWDKDTPNETITLVSNITVLQTLSCANWRNVEQLNFDVSFAPFSWIASGGDASYSESYEGHESGQLLGNMVNLIPAAVRDLSPYGLWGSQLLPQQGLISVSDVAKSFYPDHSETTLINGQGEPYVQADGPSFVSLIVNYETCEYELLAEFFTTGTVVNEQGSFDVPVVAGALYYNQQLDAQAIDTGTLSRDVSLPARYNAELEVNGFYPPGQSELIRANGNVNVHWTISVLD